MVLVEGGSRVRAELLEGLGCDANESVTRQRAATAGVQRVLLPASLTNSSVSLSVT